MLGWSDLVRSQGNLESIDVVISKIQSRTRRKQETIKFYRNAPLDERAQDLHVERAQKFEVSLFSDTIVMSTAAGSSSDCCER